MWLELIRELCPDCTFSEPATAESIKALEQALNISTPDDLKALLQVSNGVLGEYGLGLIWPVERIVKDNLLFRSPRFAELYMSLHSLLLFADAGDGTKFAFSINGNNEISSRDISSWNQIDDSRTWKAPSLKYYLEWWLQGKLHV